MPVATQDDNTPEGYTTVHGYYRFTDIFYEWCVCDPLKIVAGPSGQLNNLFWRRC